jgi:phage protein D
MPTPADRKFSLSVRFNGVEKPELYKCAETFRITEELGQGSTLHMVIALCRNDDGSWPHLEEAEMGSWQRVTVTVKVGKHTDVLLDGYISDIYITTTDQTATLKATFTVVDASYVMGLRPRCKVWPAGTTYEQIAQQIITQPPYKLTAVIEPNPPAADASAEPRSVTQRGTDLDFLRELARRRGYEFYVMGATAYFRKPVLTGARQKAIVSNFGNKTNCESLQIFVSGSAPAKAIGARIDPHTGEIVTQKEPSNGSLLPALGATTPTANSSVSEDGPVPPPVVVVKRTPAFSKEELKAYLQGVLIRSAFFLKAQGTLNALRYGAILRTRKVVSIFGFGKTYSGHYYVRKVTHMLTPRTYYMEFEAFRNAMGELGALDPSEIEDPSVASPVALGDPPDTDVVTVRESGNRVAPA